MGDRKIVFWNKTWYYSNVMSGGAVEKIMLYDENNEPVGEFSSADDMTDYVLGEASRGVQDAREEIQRSFMMRLHELQGNMNDAEFAGYLGMKYDTLYQYITGRRFPTVFALDQIAEKCGVTMDYLIGKEGR